jgi:ubiquinone/menaquinone biosynthesis C-methylase UbiE
MLNLSKQERVRARYKTMRPGYRPALEIYTELMAAQVTGRTRLLDIGCGPGGLVKAYEGIARQVVGVDRYVTHFDEPAEIHTLVEADIAQLPFASSCFDLITCSWVLEHLQHPRQVFSEAWRLLAPGGALMFITPNALNYAVWMRRLIPNSVSKPIVKAIYGRNEDFINPTYYQANSYRSIHGMLSEVGFTCERFEHIGDPSYMAVNEVMFRAAVLVEGAIDRFWPSRRVHLVGLYRKSR